MAADSQVSTPRARAGEAARGDARLVLALAALAVAARLVWVLAVPTHPVGDFAMYWESAGYVAEHGSLDPQFIYMPGYVLALALVRALGGGLFAAKLLGVAAGGLATAAVTGLAVRLYDRGAALAAGLLAALWPAGIAVSSVTGTDMPAAALLITAAWLFVRDAHERPWRAAVLFGLVMGLAAYVRAVALPFVLLAAPLGWSVDARWRRVVAGTALACAVAFLVMLPWGLRNRAAYGELFFTDSHGGHTALVGANPNTDGVYSRSLNRMFTAATGYTLLEPPHRESDRAAYAIAKQWAAFEPDYTLGLLGAKADRLLTHERPLLYWPIYRQGVLTGAARDGFARHRVALDRLADGFWYALVAAGLVGIVVSASRRIWPALALLPLPLALAALYVAFFAEVRYHLAIAVFLFPYAGLAWRWLAQGLRDLVARRLNVRGRRRILREAVLSLAAVVVVLAGWPRLMATGAELRDHHRWGVCVCHVGAEARLCSWRATLPAPGEGSSPVRGVWDGVGLQLSTAMAGAATDVDVPPGRYRVSFVADTAVPAPAPEIRLAVSARKVPLAEALLPTPAGTPPTRIEGTVEHLGGLLDIEVRAERLWTTPSRYSLPAVWISDIKIEADVR
jgi:4-amino-4-deoxy-L-arabinose transferase-like glycosyltransferase